MEGGREGGRDRERDRERLKRRERGEASGSQRVHVAAVGSVNLQQEAGSDSRCVI